MELDYVGNKIQLKDIQNLENMIKAKIPDDYKQFLLKNNGGQPKEDYIIDFLEPDVENNGSTGTDLM